MRQEGYYLKTFEEVIKTLENSSLGAERCVFAFYFLSLCVLLNLRILPVEARLQRNDNGECIHCLTYHLNTAGL